MTSNSIAVRVSHLSKQYRLGGPQEPYQTFRDAIVHSLRAPLKIFNRGPPVGEFWALKDVSFEVERGEVVGIIGRNGAGKSTLLKILSMITSPTEGTVELHGRVGSLLEVGTGFHPELTGRENIYLSGSILGMKRKEIDAKLDDIVKFSEIEKFLDTSVKRYSSGMYVRLAFSVAAHLEPEILIVDEVLAVGDAAFQKKCLGKMGEVAKDGRTVLFVSHNMGAILQLTQNTIHLEAGKLIAYGPSEKVINQYLTNSMFVQSNVYDLSNMKNRFPEILSRKIEFLQVELLTGDKTNFIRFNSPITFRLTVKGNQSVKNFRFSLTIFQINGSPVGNVFASDLQNIEKDEVALFDFTLKNLRLAPGQYYCAMAVGLGNNMTERIEFDIVVDILHFQVLPEINEFGIQTHWTPGWGAIVFDNPQIKLIGKIT